MGEIVEFPGGDKTPAVIDNVVVWDEKVAQVHTLQEKIAVSEGAALPLAMDAGDILIEIKRTIVRGRWLPFLRDCGVPIRDAQVYAQLAAARSVIEAEMRSSASHLSIRAALKLIRPKKPKSEPTRDVPETKPVKPITVTDVLDWLPTASPADKHKVAVWLAQDTAAMRKMLPPKALPPKATPKQIYERAMGLLSEDASAITTQH